MLIVAVIGLAIGAWRQIGRWSGQRREHQGEAYMLAMMEESARMNGRATHEEWGPVAWCVGSSF